MRDTVLIPNVIAVVLLLVLLFSINRVSRHVLLFDSKIFISMVSCNLVQCVGEMAAYAVDGHAGPGFYVLNLVINCVLYIVNIFFAYLWVVYVDYKIYEDIGRIHAKSRKVIIPALVVMVGTLVNLFTPVFFRITADNIYERTPLYVVPFALTYFYLLYGTIFIYRFRSQAQKFVFFPAILFMLPILVGSALQFFFYGYSTTWIGVAVALVAVYVDFQNEVTCTDVLSGLYSRTYLYQYLEMSLRRFDGMEGTLGGIMIDINDFKKINDTFGHVVGDQAIREVGKMLRAVAGKTGIAVRYGGDEFVVLLHVRAEAEEEQMMERIRAAEEEINARSEMTYQIRFSMGYSFLDSKYDTVDRFIDRMDRSMYRNKQEQKLSSGENREAR